MLIETNQAAWLTSKQARPFKIAHSPIPPPGPKEIVIRTHVAAINPCDAQIQNLGILWTRPAVLGADVAGEVIAVGSEITRFQKGDRVIGSVLQGGFAQYTTVDECVAAILPSHISYKQGAVLPLALGTAAVALFAPWTLGLNLPTLEPEAKKNGKVVVAWGASASVGACGVQMLKAAGYEVVGVAGGHNEKFCRELGVDEFFDHTKPDVVNQIIESLRGREVAGVFTAIMTTEITLQCCAIASALTTSSTKPLVVSTMYPDGVPFTHPVPANVRIAYCNGPMEMMPSTNRLTMELGWKAKPNDLAEEIWGKWVTPALEKGLLKCKPEPEVVGKGLEAVQEGVDRMWQGVSAKKLVVEIL